jgi:hypothetical protein
MAMNDAAPRQTVARRPSTSMVRLVVNLAAPYDGWLAIILLAMVVETAAGLAAAWPLKIVIDCAIAGEPVPSWMARVMNRYSAEHDARFSFCATLRLRSGELTLSCWPQTSSTPHSTGPASAARANPVAAGIAHRSRRMKRRLIVFTDQPVTPSAAHRE